jgi:putative Mg2+ transporter-C (MgtC) family protein
MKKNKMLNINFNSADITQLNALEEIVKKHKLKSKRLELFKTEDRLNVVLQITGVKKDVDLLSEDMINMQTIKDFH